MVDSFLLWTPILLVGVVALLGFVGCLTKPSPPVGLITISPASSPTAGGTAVVITGPNEDFGSNATVKFGSPPNDADVPGTIMSSTVMTAVTPAHAAGQVGVEVDYTLPHGDGTKAILAKDSYFTYYDAVVLLPPPVLSRKTTGTVNTATLAPSAGTKLVVATVQWGAGGGAVLSSVSAPGVTFSQAGTTDILNPQQVATFYAFADLTAGLIVTATLSAATNTDFNLLLAAYDNADPTSIPALPTSKQGVGTNPAPTVTLQTTGLAPGDLIYAAAIARNAATVLNGSWSQGAGFTVEAGQNSYFLLEDYVLQQSDIDAGQISAAATDANGTATSRWYVFAMAIKHS
jgi:hypothetical protein